MNADGRLRGGATRASAAERYASALVLGLGESGLAAATLLLDEGSAVTVLDQHDTPELRARAAVLQARGAEVLLGASSRSGPSPTVAVVSPGIAAGSPWLRAVAGAGTPLRSELELGASRCQCPVLAITGTNGKSTLTTLCAEALTLGGMRVASGGNLGTPLARIAPRSASLDWVAVEVSSFQLETVEAFRPRVGILLNIQPNHLDRHGDMSTYLATKCRLFRRMRAGDTAVVPETLVDAVRGEVQAAHGDGADGGPAWRTFGESANAAYRYVPGAIRTPNGDVDLVGTRFDNPVLGLAVAAAAAALDACGLATATLTEAVRRNRPLPHRMMDLGAIGGVRFINDSKATSLAAMAAALGMLPEPVRLIAGGLLKEYDLSVVQELLAKKTRGVYGIGKGAAAMMAAWSGTVACRDCGDLETAVRAAWSDAEPGEVVLLSPGCASFDQFRNFEERGQRFASVVERIREEEDHEEVVVV